jgi:tetratricopeptide (TPR) repeat protein
VAFKVNLFSALFACLTLIVLFGCGRRMLALLYPEEDPERFTAFALLPPGILAFSFPFWNQSVQAEVYTLHAFFLSLLVYLLLRWRQSEDVRLVYAAGLVYGLAAGNHATAAFWLPALLVLFFMWNRQGAVRHLTGVICFFLVGLSVYTYLPVRSLMEPSFDWGNPETVNNFLYQVTDRKDAHTHFSHVRQSAAAAGPATAAESLGWVDRPAKAVGEVTRRLFRDLSTYLTPWVAVGFVAGALICLRKNLPLFIFFLFAVASNASFFSGWGRESFFPTYIAACLLTTLFLYRLLRRHAPGHEKKPDSAAREDFSSRVRSKLEESLPFLRKTGIPLVMAALVLTIPVLVFRNYSAVDRSGQYFAETLLKREFLSLDNHALFIPGMSWFNFHYHNDVMRLRDDVVAMNAWDFMADHPAGIFTRRRYPSLSLPGPDHNFSSREETFAYIQELFDRNASTRPILIEQNIMFFDQYPMADRFLPHRNLLVKYEKSGVPREDGQSGSRGLAEFKSFLEADISQPEIQQKKNIDWINKVAYFIPSFAEHYRDRGMYAEEREALELQFNFLGQNSPENYLKWVENLILDGRLDEAKAKWREMAEGFSGSSPFHLAEGLIARAEGRTDAALHSFEKAMAGAPENYRPAIETAVLLLERGDRKQAVALARRALGQAKSLREVYFIRKNIDLH